MRQRLGWSKGPTVALACACVVPIDSVHAQIDDCVAQLDSCIESAVIPDEAQQGGRLLNEVWLTLGQSRELGAAYFMGEVGLQRESALALAEYALWAYDAMNAHNRVLQAHYCGLLEGVTTGPELDELYQDGWDWELRKFQEVDRLAMGVFAILSEQETTVLLAYLNELMQEPRGISSSAPLLDLDTWSRERVARIIGYACDPDRY